jgi:hypothetical protein
MKGNHAQLILSSKEWNAESSKHIRKDLESEAALFLSRPFEWKMLRNTSYD